MMKFLGLPELVTVHGKDVDNLILYVHLLMGALFIGWLSYFLYTIFRFNTRSNPKANYTGVTSHASTYIEGAVALIEAVLLIGFAVPLWARVSGELPKNATVIRVTAEQFAWNSRYPGPDGVFGKQDLRFVNATNVFGIDYTDPAAKDDFVGPLGEIAAPWNAPVVAHITSKDVIHSFKIIPFRITQDAMPGLSIPIWWEFNKDAQKEAKYMINCAQLCGNSHAFMRGTFLVMSPAQFAAWSAEKSKAGAGGAGGFE
jgi:cytochrome c oxidase subunit II